MKNAIENNLPIIDNHNINAEKEPAEKRYHFEKWEAKTEMEREGVKLVRFLTDKGFTAYFAGGYPRDMAMANMEDSENFHPHDIDIATSAGPDEVIKVLRENNTEALPLGKVFGTVAVFIGGHKFDIATFRTDGEYSDGRRPDSVEFKQSAEEDAHRRDFTINSLYFNPLNKEVVDYIGGIEDIKSKTLRFNGDASQRIKEDKLRMLRYARFLSKFNFNFDKETRDVIKEFAPEIKNVSAERIREEMEKMLELPNSWLAISNLRRTGLLKEILPEVDELAGVTQGQEYHSEGDVYRHTVETLRSFSSEKFLNEYALINNIFGDYEFLFKDFVKNNKNVLWAALLHDIAKKQTKEEVVKDGRLKIQFHKHDLMSSEMAGEICNRLRFANQDKSEIKTLIAEHMRHHNLIDMKESKRKTEVLKPLFKKTLFLGLADILSSWNSEIDSETGEHKKGMENFNFIKENYLDILRENKDIAPLINGRDLFDLGVENKLKSNIFGIILKKVRELQLSGELLDEDAALSFVWKRYGLYIINRNIITGHDLLTLGVSRGPQMGRIIEDVENKYRHGELKTNKEIISYIKENYLS